MAMFRCGGDGGVKPLTFTQKIRYADSHGNFGIAIFVIENKWKKVKATNLSNVQYASVFDADTGERLQLHVPDVGELDISSIKKIELRLQQTVSAGSAGAEVTWVLS